MSFQSLANRYVCDVPVYEPGRPIEEVAREMGLNPKIDHQAGIEREPARAVAESGGGDAQGVGDVAPVS